MKAALEKVGSFGALVAAAACPVCFPKLALVGALVGLGAFSAYEAQLFIAAQLLVVLAVLGHVLSFLSQRKPWPFGTALAGGAAVFAGLYVAGSEWLVYAGFAALVAASIPRLWRPSAGRRLRSVITCPQCGAQRTERMPTDACQFFYDCSGCGATLRPKRGDCCVFCSYGSVPCPPMQAARQA